MKIAVNTRFLQNDFLEGYGYFIYETLKRIVHHHPEHEFLFVFDRPFDPNYIFSKNVTPVIAGPQTRHPLLWKYWYDYALSRAAKKFKADLILSMDGFCSLRTKIPQIMVVHDLAFLHYPKFIKSSHKIFYHKYTKQFLNKAKKIATVSEYSKQDIIHHFKISEEKISVVYSAANDIFKPLNFDEQEEVRNKYTDGKSYFIYVGAIHPRKNLMSVLKAFSVFKKKLLSNMKLVIVGRVAWHSDDITKSLETYKYRQDVIMKGYLPKEELAKLMASAYALVYPSFFEGFGVPPVEAMKSGVPAIVSNVSSLPEIAGNAGLYVNPESFEDIGEKMILLYKNEELRKKLIENGFVVAEQYNWDNTAELLWETIEAAMQ